MKELGSCVGPISGEHIISESVMRVLMAGGDFSISGLPWLEAGEERILAPQNLTANRLCVKHNSALHPLDDAAQYFFASLKSYLELGAGSRHAIVSGHDIERWLLKTAKAAAVSKNFARGRERLSGAFSRDEAILDMLDNPRQWPDSAGLYCVMNTGDLTVNHSRFQFQPLTNDQDEIEALALNILGLRFVLLLEPPNVGKYPFLREAKYRPLSRWARCSPGFPCVSEKWLRWLLFNSSMLSRNQIRFGALSRPPLGQGAPCSVACSGDGRACTEMDG